MVGKGQIKHEITDEKESSVLEGLPRTGGCNLSYQRNFYLIDVMKKNKRSNWANTLSFKCATYYQTQLGLTDKA